MLTWYVYKEDVNARVIEKFNIFKHSSFAKDVQELLDEYVDREIDRKEFSEAVKRKAMYYFWSKSEYEVIITSWPVYITVDEFNRIAKETEKVKYYINIAPAISDKVDIFDQLNLNWEAFIDYLLKPVMEHKI